MCHSGVNRRPGFQTRRPSGPRGKKPTISALGASSGDRWFANRTLTITGSNFDTGATVSFGSTGGISAAFSAGTLTFTIPEHELFEAGNKNVTVTYGGVTSAPATYTVTQPSSLYAGYRADSGITLNGSNVSQWNDFTGNGRHLTQATSSRQPGYGSNSVNFANNPTVGPKSYGGLVYTGTIAGPYTMFTVANQQANNPGTFPISIPVYNSSATECGIIYGLDGYASIPPGGIAGLSGSTWVDNNGPLRKYKVTTPVAAVFDSTARLYRGTNSAATASITVQTLSGIMVCGASSYQVAGPEMAEAMLFNAALTDAQIAVLNRYSTYRYGTSVVTKTDGTAMTNARGNAGSGQLSDGRIAVIGGVDTSNAFTSTVQLYDPIANTWASGTSVPSGILTSATNLRHSVVRLGNGKLFLYAGDTTSGGTFDGSTWTTSANTVSAHGVGCSTVLMSNGKVGVFGGATRGTAISIWDPATNNFSSSSASITSRSQHAAISLDNGKVLLIAGDSVNTNCQLYDPTADTVSSTGSLGTARTSFHAVKLGNGKVLVTGSGTSAELYDPNAGTWSNVSNTTYGNANTGGYAAPGGRFGDGTAILPGCDTGATGRVNVYATTEGAFHTVDARATEAHGAAIVNMADGRVFVAGGDSRNITGGTYASDKVAIFDKITSDTAPSISQLGAWSGERWFASTSMTLTGKNLGVGAKVNFGSTTGITTTYTAGTSNVGTLSFTVPESEFWEVGNRNVTVTYNGVTTSALTFTVTQPTALIQDLRADRGITLNGSTVSSWSSYDTSGDTNRNVTQATASLQPTYRSSDADFNNKPSIKFGTSGSTRLDSGAFNTGVWAQTSVAAVICSANIASGTIQLMSDGFSAAYRLYTGDYNAFSGITGTTVFHGGPSETVNSTRTTVPSAIFAQYEGSIGGATTERIFVRSASSGVSATKGTNNGFTGLIIGETYGTQTTYRYQGAIAEWILFNAPLTQDQRTRLGNYFSARYGSAVMTP